MVVTASYKVNENRNSNKNKKMLQSNSTSPKHKGLKELGPSPSVTSLSLRPCDQEQPKKHFSWCTVPDGQSPWWGRRRQKHRTQRLGGTERKG